MQEENKIINYKKILLIIIPFILVLILLFLLLNKKEDNREQIKEKNKINIPIFGEKKPLNFELLENNEILIKDKENNKNNLSEDNIEQIKILYKINDKPTLSAFINKNRDVFYIEKSGKFAKKSFPYKKEEFIDEIKNNCYKAEISKTLKILMLCFDGFYYYSGGYLEKIDNNAYDFKFLDDGNSFVFLKQTEIGTSFVLNKNNNKNVLFNIPLYNLKILQSDSDGFYFSEKPNENLSQNIFYYSFKNKNYSLLGDISKQKIDDFEKGFVFEKCVVLETKDNFCLIDTNINISDWRKGFVVSIDKAHYLIESRFEFLNELEEKLDVLNVGLSEDKEDLFIINKKDQVLYLFYVGHYFYIHSHKDEE